MHFLPEEIPEQPTKRLWLEQNSCSVKMRKQTLSGFAVTDDRGLEKEGAQCLHHHTLEWPTLAVMRAGVIFSGGGDLPSSVRRQKMKNIWSATRINFHGSWIFSGDMAGSCGSQGIRPPQ